jgi:hypothetical protein
LKSLRTLLAASLLLLLPAFAHAQLTLTLDAPSLSGYPGDTLTFTGTLTNSGASLVFINGTNFNLNGTGLTFNDDDFILNGPLSLGAGEIFNGTFFQVQIDPVALPQVAPGSFFLLGGATDTAQSTIATTNFSVAVGAAPEPASATLMLGIALATGAAGRLRRRRTGHQ